MIRIATQKEAVDLFNKTEIINRVGKKANSFIYQPFIAFNANSEMLFVFWSNDDGSVEIHIAQPREYIHSSRELCGKIINWLFDHGAQRVVTSAPEGKIANLARKVGMRKYKADSELIYFEVVK